jgi:hypothetical protein
MSLVTRRCFGLDWEQSTDITKYYDIPFPSYRDMSGRTLPDEWEKNISALLDDQRFWEERDVVFYTSASPLWGQFTNRSDFLSGEFSYLGDLTQLQKGYLVLNLLFSKPTAFLEKESRSVISRVCADDNTIGVHFRLTEDRHSNQPENVTRLCFANESMRLCHYAIRQNPAKKQCAFFVTTDLPARLVPQFLEELKEDLNGFRGSTEYKLFLSPSHAYHIDSFNLMYFLFGYWNADDYISYLGTYLDWQILKSMDMLLLSFSGFSLSAYWFSGPPTYVYPYWGILIHIFYFLNSHFLEPPVGLTCPKFRRAHRKNIFQLEDEVCC